jgi:hypothetical protein
MSEWYLDVTPCSFTVVYMRPSKTNLVNYYHNIRLHIPGNYILLSHRGENLTSHNDVLRETI